MATRLYPPFFYLKGKRYILSAIGEKVTLPTWLTISNAGAFFAALVSIVSLVGALARYPYLADLFKTKDELIRERNLEKGHAADARQTTADLSIQVSSLRQMFESDRHRLEALEKMKPVYDAALMYTPVAFEHLQFLDMVAKNAKLDLGGKEMPALPAVLVKYFEDNKK